MMDEDLKLNPDELGQDMVDSRIKLCRMIFLFWSLLLGFDILMLTMLKVTWGQIPMGIAQVASIGFTVYPLYNFIGRDWKNFWRLRKGTALAIGFTDFQTYEWIVENVPQTDFYTMTLGTIYVFRDPRQAVAVKLMRKQDV